MLGDYLVKIILKIKEIPKILKGIGNIFGDMFKFAMLVSLYITSQIFYKVVKFKLMPHSASTLLAKTYSRLYSRAVATFERKDKETISRIDLIEIAIRNMGAKKARTIITVGGMSLGIAAIVFLVSVGYGLQKLVISRVARLDELKQADVNKNPGSKMSVNDKSVADIKQVTGVANVLPLISVVGRVEFNNSVTDVAVYGVTSDYLKYSAVKPYTGDIFDSNELTVSVTKKEDSAVAGARSARSIPKLNAKIGDLDYVINPGEWVRVRQGPSVNSSILGYTKRMEGKQSGELIWGSYYESENPKQYTTEEVDGTKYGKWVKSTVTLWERKDCDKKDIDCFEGKYVTIKDESGSQLQSLGYFAQMNINNLATYVPAPDVLGLTTSEASQSTGTGMTIKVTDNPNFIEILEESSSSETQRVTKIDLNASSKKLAVVNKAFVRVLGMKDYEAVGKEFNISFIVTSDLLTDSKEKMESNLAGYKIVGITPDDKVPMMYVPFIDLRSLGITNFSQLRMVVKDPSFLPKSRMQVESMGFVTRSVADTVSQINSFFQTVRLVLGLMGVVALVVASLGMFNTLTVSLLERTREVGLLRAMGMKSSEVRELFLCESIIMGVFGGAIGVIIGFVAGKLLGLLLTLFALTKGVGIIDVTSLPLSFLLLIMSLSVSVGFVTGIYPANRAKKISALNALRYE